MDLKLARACEGKAPSQGGLYVSEFRNELSNMYPEHADKIQNMTRTELTRFCKENSDISSEVKSAKDKYFKPNSPLNDDQKRICRCIMHTAKQSPRYNPYAICRASTKVAGQISCSSYFDYDNIPEQEGEDYARFKNKSVRELKE